MDIPLNNKNFQKIIKFYLFECPVRTVARIDKKQPNGGKRHREYKKVSKMEFAADFLITEGNKPILAICRGEQLLNVDGIGEKTLESIRPFCRLQD